MMQTPTISDTRIFYVTREFNGEKLEENPLAQGFTASRIDTDTNKYWGVVSWFDKINGSMRTVEVTEKPEKPNEHTYVVTTPSSGIYKFQAVDKTIYNTCLRQIIPMLPELSDENAIQQYLINLNPYS